MSQELFPEDSSEVEWIRTVQRITVLAVDDEPLLCELFISILSDAGFIVYAATSLASAISILNECEINVVVSDVQMPNGSGIDLLREINTMGEGRPSVFLVSAYSGINTDEARLMGAADLLAKPINYEELSRKIVAEHYRREFRLKGKTSHHVIYP